MYLCFSLSRSLTCQLPKETDLKWEVRFKNFFGIQLSTELPWSSIIRIMLVFSLFFFLLNFFFFLILFPAMAPCGVLSVNSVEIPWRSFSCEGFFTFTSSYFCSCYIFFTLFSFSGITEVVTSEEKLIFKGDLEISVHSWHRN